MDRVIARADGFEKPVYLEGSRKAVLYYIDLVFKAHGLTYDNGRHSVCIADAGDRIIREVALLSPSGRLECSPAANLAWRIEDYPRSSFFDSD